MNASKKDISQRPNNKKAMKRLNFKEKKAKDLLERILADLNRKFGSEMFVHVISNFRNGRPAMFITNNRYFGNESRRPINLLGIVKGKLTYARLFNKLVKWGLYAPSFASRKKINIIEMYGSTYEEIMMNLELSEVE